MNHLVKQCTESNQTRTARNSPVSAVEEEYSDSNTSSENILGVKMLENHCKYSRVVQHQCKDSRMAIRKIPQSAVSRDVANINKMSYDSR